MAEKNEPIFMSRIQRLRQSRAKQAAIDIAKGNISLLGPPVALTKEQQDIINTPLPTIPQAPEPKKDYKKWVIIGVAGFIILATVGILIYKKTRS